MRYEFTPKGKTELAEPEVMGEKPEHCEDCQPIAKRESMLIDD